VAHQLTVIAHDVFVSGFIDAMKSTFVVPISVLAFTAVTTLLIRRVPQAAARAEIAEEVQAAAV